MDKLYKYVVEKYTNKSKKYQLGKKVHQLGNILAQMTKTVYNNDK